MNIVEWLMDADPAIRWQVMRDLTDAADDEIAAERARVATEAWGAQLLALQGPDGRWDGGTYRPGWVDQSKPFFDAWTATHFSLWLLRDLGLLPESPEARHAISLVRDNVRWEANGAPYFEGETEPCINGITLANGAYFGEKVDGIAERLLSEPLNDGGWNCWAEHGAKVSSFHTTLCVLEGLLEWERARGSSKASAQCVEDTLSRARRLSDNSARFRVPKPGGGADRSARRTRKVGLTWVRVMTQKRGCSLTRSLEIERSSREDPGPSVR